MESPLREKPGFVGPGAYTIWGPLTVHKNNLFLQKHMTRLTHCHRLSRLPKELTQVCVCGRGGGGAPEPHGTST